MRAFRLGYLWIGSLLNVAPFVIASLVAGGIEAQASTGPQSISESAGQVPAAKPDTVAQSLQQRTETDSTRATAGPNCADAMPSTLPPGNSKLTVVVDPSTVWQPRGGEIRFTITATGFSLDGAQLIACIQWRNAGGATNPLQIPPMDLRVIEAVPGRVTIGATVPPGLADPPRAWWWERLGASGEGTGAYTGLDIVPIADLRVIAKSSAAGSPAWLPFDVTIPIGITSLLFAFVVVFVSVLAAWATLWTFGKVRGAPGSGPFLKIISTKGGYASLSQLQIMLWTFLIGASAIYVMVLSGNLINITEGMLALLGITGVSTIGSKLQSHVEARSAPPKPIAPPGTVTGLASSAGSEPDCEVLLTWQAPETGGRAAAYTVRYREQGTSPWVVASRSLAWPDFRVVGLKPSTAYQFEVRGVNSGGPGAPSTVAHETADARAVTGPGPVSDLSHTSAVTGSEIGLAWTALSGASAYTVGYRAHDGDDDWTIAATAFESLEFLVAGLAPNTRYDFRVAAISGQGNRGPWSAIVAARTWPRRPHWSDLVVVADGQGEVDVTRVQMLFFTVVSALFVSLKVLTSSAIPEIPEGFLLLMGISNGVYITAKFVPN